MTQISKKMTKATHLYNFKFTCPKCGNSQYTVDKFQAAGSFWFHDFLNKKFTTVTCTRCFYTEIYKISIKEFTEMAHITKN